MCIFLWVRYDVMHFLDFKKNIPSAEGAENYEDEFIF